MRQRAGVEGDAAKPGGQPGLQCGWGGGGRARGVSDVVGMVITLAGPHGAPLPLFCRHMSENGQAEKTAAEPRDSTHAHLAGEVIDRHQHGYHQLLYVSAGVVAVQTGEASWVASSARAVWIPAGTWHQHRVHGHSSVHTLGFAAHDSLLRSEAPVVLVVDALVRELIIACSEPSLPQQEARRLRAVLRDRLRRALVEPLTLPTPATPCCGRRARW